MWACYGAAEWARSPEWAFSGWAFCFALIFGALGTPWRAAATWFVRVVGILVSVQAATLIVALELGRRHSSGRENPSDIYVRASTVLSCTWVLVAVLVIAFALAAALESGEHEDIAFDSVAVPAVALVLATVGLVGASLALALFVQPPSITSLECAFGLAGLAAPVVTLLLPRWGARGPFLGLGIGCMVAVLPARGLAHSRAEPFAFTDECLADRFLSVASRSAPAEEAISALRRRESARLSGVDRTLRALCLTRGTRVRPGYWLLPEVRAPSHGHMDWGLQSRYSGNPETDLLRVQIERGRLEQPLAWLADASVDPETREDVERAICGASWLPPGSCQQAKVARRNGGLCR